ncbi:DEAD/DEAH box helicase [Methanocella arvoryzae]|uniref:Type III restriction-modification system, restriction subunit n=1 Tax=Methanocella arvoryzae (strain DSM 22066 / NBRC 105507 / MRE50) TaxID=351160 RepID=Q0W4Y0_METAR|nr:DEAD/DEAH box helicase [Methanocella arvoryzae]CAJ36563.1 putative type III restriction-modification system, restriction subunit [Methanocella arvoryzae MRE50]
MSGDFVSHPLLVPNTVSSRSYQETLSQKALEKSSLIVLPTGLGKTIIALLVILNRLQAGGPGAKVLMLSPTKPLVEQHASFFRKAMAIDPEKIVVFTGSTPPEERADLWDKATVIVSTPQVIENDLLCRRFTLEDVTVVVFDEAHRATGNYAYVYIAKRYMEQARSPLVLGITASPGSTPEKINEVRESLAIERVEVKTENDPDVAPYIYDKDVEWIRVNVPDKANEIRILLEAIVEDRAKKLFEMGVIYSKNIVLNKKELLLLQQRLQAAIARGSSPESYKAISVVAEIMKVGHAIDLIQTQGVLPLRRYFERMKEEASTKGGSKATRRLFEDARLQHAMRVTNETDEVNPKTEKVAEIVLEQLQANPASKVIVFTNYRDTADVVAKRLAEVEGIKPVRFVGQASKLNDKGLSQKKQVEILDRFRAGEYNTLIATSVAEEGLDIPSTDLVLFYEPVPSEIRSIQRRGRTGRNTVGRVVVLISKGTRDEAAYRSSQSKERKMYKTMQNMKDGEAMAGMLEHNSEFSQATIDDIAEEPPVEDAAVMTGGSSTVSLQPPSPASASQAKLELFAARDNGVTVLTDTREMRSQVVKKLEEHGAKLDFRTLEVGDYVLSDRVCIERKTTDDFLSTIFDANRNMFEQIINMKHEFLRPMLIIEGSGLYTKRRISPAAIQGIIASITIDYGVPVLFTADEAETASYIYSIARREQVDRKRSVHPHATKASQTLPERQEYLVSAISEVGPVIAKNLLRHFGSVKKIAEASAEELTAVERVGPKTAARIREIMDAEYRPRE